MDAVRPAKACFTCGATTHYSGDCAHRPSLFGALGDQLCPVCRRTGHTARSCPQLPMANRTQPIHSSFLDPAHASGTQPSRTAFRDPASSSSASYTRYQPSTVGGRPPLSSASHATSAIHEPCLNWNRKGTCKQGDACPRRHTCLLCARGHPMRDCPDQSR